MPVGEPKHIHVNLQPGSHYREPARLPQPPAGWSNKSARQSSVRPKTHTASGFQLHVLALELPQLSK